MSLMTFEIILALFFATATADHGMADFHQTLVDRNGVTVVDGLMAFKKTDKGLMLYAEEIVSVRNAETGQYEKIASKEYILRDGAMYLLARDHKKYAREASVKFTLQGMLDKVAKTFGVDRDDKNVNVKTPIGKTHVLLVNIASSGDVLTRIKNLSKGGLVEQVVARGADGRRETVDFTIRSRPPRDALFEIPTGFEEVK